MRFEKHVTRRKESIQSHILGLPLAACVKPKGAPSDQTYTAQLLSPPPLFIPTAAPSNCDCSQPVGGETEALGFSPESTAVKADSHEPECSGGRPPVTSEEANRAGGFQQNGTKLPDRPPASCHPLNPCGQRGRMARF